MGDKGVDNDNFYGNEENSISKKSFFKSENFKLLIKAILLTLVPLAIGLIIGYISYFQK